MFDFKQLLVDSGIIVHWNNQNRWISYVIWALKLRKPRKFTISRVAESQYTNFLLVVMAHIQWHHVSALNLNRHGFCPCWFNFEAIGRLVSRVKFVGHRLLEPRVLVEDHWPMTRSPLIWNICVFICKNWYFDNGRVQSRFLSTWYQSPIILPLLTIFRSLVPGIQQIPLIPKCQSFPSLSFHWFHQIYRYHCFYQFHQFLSFQWIKQLFGQSNLSVAFSSIFCSHCFHNPILTLL